MEDSKSEVIKCFICKEVIPEKETSDAEMIAGPGGDKVFVHIRHKGVKKEVQEEYSGE